MTNLMKRTFVFVVIKENYPINCHRVYILDGTDRTKKTVMTIVNVFLTLFMVRIRFASIWNCRAELVMAL